MSDPKINLPLIRKVLRHIKAEPKRLEMGTWHMRVEESTDKYRSKFPACGTRACFAGWVYILSPKTKAESNHRLKLPCPNISFVREDALKALGFTSSEADLVFAGEATGSSTFSGQFELLLEALNEVLAGRGLKARVD